MSPRPLRREELRVFMMDLWATVPYYTAYLSRALQQTGIAVQVGSITYYLDLECFRGRGLEPDPGLLDVVGRFNLPTGPRRLFKMLEALANMAALTAKFLVRSPDVIHIQYLPLLRWMPLEHWFLRFCHWRGAKLVLTVHDLLPHDTAARFQQTFTSLYGGMDALICHSQTVKQRLESEFGVAPERVFVIPHGPFFYDLPVPSNENTTLKRSPVRVLWQGILFPYKGLDVLLEAWQTVEQSGAETHLTVAGTGSPELLEQTRGQVQRLGLKQITLDLRFVSPEELVALYRAADLVVYPYRAITTSGALATGLALGKTLLASDLPVFRELLTDEHNALLVAPGDAGMLATALLRLIREPSLREHLAQNVQAMQFGDESWSAIARKTGTVYLQTLSAGPAHLPNSGDALTPAGDRVETKVQQSNPTGGETSSAFAPILDT